MGYRDVYIWTVCERETGKCVCARETVTTRMWIKENFGQRVYSDGEMRARDRSECQVLYV